MVESSEGAFDPITVVLADDHALVRGGLRRVLEAEDDMKVLAEAGDADEAIRVVGECRPRIVLLDVNMPGTPSLDAIPTLLAAAPGCCVVMLTMHDEFDFARDALAAGRAATCSRTPPSGSSSTRCARSSRGATTSIPASARERGRGSGAGTPAGGAGDRLTFAGHRVDAVAGRGGMGIVYRATDLVLGRRVALKVIAPAFAADPLPRPLRAESPPGRLDRPPARGRRLPRRRGGRPAVRDDALRPRHRPTAMLHEDGRLELERAVRLAAQVAGALDAAHRLGLVHRDVKPANVLMACATARNTRSSRTSA